MSERSEALAEVREQAALMEQMFGVRIVHVCLFCGSQIADVSEVSSHVRSCDSHPGVRLPRG